MNVIYLLQGASNKLPWATFLSYELTLKGPHHNHTTLVQCNVSHIRIDPVPFHRSIVRLRFPSLGSDPHS